MGDKTSKCAQAFDLFWTSDDAGYFNHQTNQFPYQMEVLCIRVLVSVEL